MHIELGGTARTEQHIRELALLGLKYAEVSISDPEAFETEAPGFAAAAKEAGIKILAHGPREGNPNDVLNLHQKVLPRLQQSLEILSTLGASLLTIHLWMDSRFVKPDMVSAKIRVLDTLLKRAKAANCSICLENLSESWQDLKIALDELPELGLTLDLGHAQLLTERNRAFDIIERFPERIKHLHLHDNRGGSSYTDDLHLPVGEGAVPFKELFETLRRVGFTGTATLELKIHEIEACLPRVKQLLA